MMVVMDVPGTKSLCQFLQHLLLPQQPLPMLSRRRQCFLQCKEIGGLGLETVFGCSQTVLEKHHRRVLLRVINGENQI